MSTKTDNSQGNLLHASDFKKMILGANYFFEREKEKINALNVFPVPDGDTGTNMSMTLRAAVDGTMAYQGQSIGELSEIVASRALLGARGNSGVILSQILRGIARGLRKKDHISPAELSKAFQYGVVYAYRAVSKPVEGTILTVSREMARGIRAAARKGENLYNSFEAAVNSGKDALAKTTDMLPALKEAGVVDAGGLGLLVFLEGCLFSLKRSIHELMAQRKPPADSNGWLNISIPGESSAASGEPEEFNLEYPYCTEFIIKNDQPSFSSLQKTLEEQGDSLLVAFSGTVAKVHIHTANPGIVLQLGQQFGTLHDLKIDNMIDQHTELADSPVSTDDNRLIVPPVIPHEKGETGVIVVSFGEGFREIFLSLGADEIVYGGQTMNPKVEDLLQAVENLPQQKVFILPNNKNIILVAEQVNELSDKQVDVLKTRTLPEGLAALVSFSNRLSHDENLQVMINEINRINTGLLTYATRDTKIGNHNIKAGQYLGLKGDQIIKAGDNLEQTALELVELLITDSSDIITVFYGQDISRQEAAALVRQLEKQYPDLEIEPQYGGQPIYYYIFSVE